MATTHDDDNDDDRHAHDVAAKFKGVWPYWMDRMNAVPNTFDLDGMFLLTAPNMSGKSTLMRTAAAAALLATCGLAAPLEKGSSIRRFETLFLRGASSDIPSENKSAFGAEMEDIASLLRSANSRSLVFVDELGRGTSPRDGTSIAAAVLEAMAKKEMAGMFATHLHDVLTLPLDGWSHIRKKRMSMEQRTVDERVEYTWTYCLEDGVCESSLAFVTAKQFGLPDSVLDRALAFSAILDDDAKDDENEINKETFPISPTRARVLENAVDVAFGSPGDNAGVVCHIPPSWTPPPWLEGNSCVYILQLDTNPPLFYVGETDSFQKRLQQHRKKGERWSMAAAAVIPIKGGKSDARSVESFAIQRLAQAGFHLVSLKDGYNLQQSNRQ